MIRLTASAVLFSLLSVPAAADGEFFQIDLSESSTTAVASIGRDRLTYGLTFVDSGDTRTLAARAALAFPVGPVTVRAGPELQVDLRGENETEAGIVLSADRWTATDFGSVYWLVEGRTIDRSTFASLQFGLADGWGIELSRGQSDDYAETALAVSRRFGGGPWGVRAGYRFDADEAFVGITFNSY